METNVFYGEYSLDHWIHLLETGNIKLPKIQRSFTWKDYKIKRLIKSLHNKQFIPPVIVIRSNQENLIIDGQQRLTSLLLAYRNKYPTRKNLNNKWKYCSQSDGNTTATNFDDPDGFTDYDFFEGIGTSNIDKNDFFKDKFLGFTFISPQSDDKNKQEQFFAQTFYSINTQAELLTADEKLEAYKLIAPELKNIISSKFEEYFKVSRGSNKLIRILGYILQYRMNEDFIQTAEKTEDFANIIESLSNRIPVDLFGKRGEIVRDFDYSQPYYGDGSNYSIFEKTDDTPCYMEILEKIKIELNKNKNQNPNAPYKFDKIVHFDVLFFGFYINAYLKAIFLT
ncbi:DUF262 domain-containing protein [Neisseria flavescens]|uniref:DUF262 domain-containing protein n=1 Tax=Neisseria flavescens TaxID=484 RepID=UPI000A951ECD|nr:DUF262 domain-containing protein [Neisseria flavescens]